MSRFYRYRLPPWCRAWLFAIETAILPVMIFQLFRTIIFPTTLDVFLSGIIIGIFFAFRLKWI
ncbi:hypothetical protein MUN89_10195 [Halobacillus salinarum]|uniref:Uncharacterized protein n=1 Tax=Halobacillus salinarum TaxID=2932257 RepID=A0ABY4EQQ8_9BACI|nr:hypothetical protein [Halobacillus salinarum]UOQ46242.1 hypothetical protein MUN89_10195 [Halobacillus salinarum]